MRHPIDFRALRPYALLLLIIGALGLATGSWIKGILHISSQGGANAVDFAFGLALGLGLSLWIASFTLKAPRSAEADQ